MNKVPCFKTVAITSILAFQFFFVAFSASVVHSTPCHSVGPSTFPSLRPPPPPPPLFFAILFFDQSSNTVDIGFSNKSSRHNPPPPPPTTTTTTTTLPGVQIHYLINHADRHMTAASKTITDLCAVYVIRRDFI